MPKVPRTPSPSKSPSKPPSTPKKKRSYAWKSPITERNVGGGELAVANGPFIKRTKAVEKYKIKATDLDTIKPISRQQNHMGGSSLIQTYNECDVAALAQRLRPGKPLPELSPMANPVVLAKKNGPRIMKTTAITKFKLRKAEIEQLTPISMTPNAYGSLTTYYNRCDVENLKSRLEQLRGASSSRLIDFDGLDRGDAAALLAEARSG
ncbi:hypothetical protein R3P38DRAFT_2829363 [Favolaschia claudopus]|uniref:Uncharacterized protein n=1 Tax=Favolaschia claudopus TaxID=2862362 RepID=A0AAW0EAK4_9AGAR